MILFTRKEYGLLYIETKVFENRAYLNTNGHTYFYWGEIKEVLYIGDFILL